MTTTTLPRVANSTKSTKKSALRPAIRLAAPAATVSSNGVVLQVSCAGSCRGEAELSKTVSVGHGARRILETEVLAATAYRLAGVAVAKLRVPLTSAGRLLLVHLRTRLVVEELLTVKGGKTLTGHVRLTPPATKSR